MTNTHVTRKHVRAMSVVAMTIVSLLAISTMVSAQGSTGGFQSSPEVILGTPTLNDDTPDEGVDVTVTVEVTNNDTMPLPGLAVTLMVGYDTIETVNVSLAPGQNMSVDLTWTAAKWSTNVTVVVTMEGLQMPLASSYTSVEVTPEPIGDTGTLISALTFVVLSVMAISILGTVGERVLRR